MISVIVPVYNVKKYLPQCLESLCNQTYQALEIILVDDGSTDGSGELCDEFGKRDSRITVLHTKNQGAESARKTGLLASKGEYVSIVDSDDWLEKDMYEKLFRRMQEQNVDVVMCDRYEDTDDFRKEVRHGIPGGRYDKQALMEQVYPQMICGASFFEWCIFPGLWDKLFRSEVLKPFKMAVDERITMGDDAACVYPCLLNVDSIYVLHECLYHYRQTTSSMVKGVPDYNLERERFHILYQTVSESLARYASVYDLREQWKKYVLFLMVPRADGLYEGFDKLDFLFPFPKVKKGSNIVLYGAGTYGQRLYRYLERTGFCKVVLLVDRNYLQLQRLGVPVETPEQLVQVEYDAIVVTNTYEKSRKALYQTLIQRYPREKIHLIDEDCIFSKETLGDFRLEE